MKMPATAIDGGRREARKRKTRRRILESAFRLFQERGYTATSLAQIAERAGVAPRTVSNYFALKADILVAYREEMLEVVEETLGRRRDLMPVERVQAALLASASRNARHPSGRLAQRLLADHASYQALRRIQARYEADLRQALEGSELRPGTDPELAVLALAAGHLAVLQRWSQGLGGPLVPAVERLFAQWRSGVLP